jgi:folate-binding protein YgfZ
MAPPDLPALLFTSLQDSASFEATGADRQSWLNGLVTCNLAPLKPGQGAYGLATSKVGKILADLDILILPGSLLFACPGPRRAALHENLERYLVMEDVEILDASQAWRWFLLHGAGAEAAAAALAAEFGGHHGALDRTGLGDAALAVPADRAAPAEQAVRRAASPLRDHDWLRISKQIPLFGVDFDENNYPQEATLERRAVSFCKGCYLGQEVVCRLEMRGHVHKRLAALRIEGQGALPPRAPALAAGAEIGHVTSSALHPEGFTVALAMLKFAHAEPGSPLEIDGRPATVLEPPR